MAATRPICHIHGFSVVFRFLAKYIKERKFSWVYYITKIRSVFAREHLGFQIRNLFCCYAEKRGDKLLLDRAAESGVRRIEPCDLFFRRFLSPDIIQLRLLCQTLNLLRLEPCAKLSAPGQRGLKNVNRNLQDVGGPGNGCDRDQCRLIQFKAAYNKIAIVIVKSVKYFLAFAACDDVAAQNALEKEGHNRLNLTRLRKGRILSYLAWLCIFCQHIQGVLILNFQCFLKKFSCKHNFPLNSFI
ncbi:MAG: hypothetical protein LUD54_00625 [Oscillospiraceae bacterium]|nr:hypothetical protein [Oscillospiraceae bacterium]